GCYVWHSGDGFYSAFPEPRNAVLCARDLQAATHSNSWPSDLPEIRLRIGIHVDRLTLKGDEYRGFGLSRAQRLMDAGHGRQIMMSGAAFEVCRQQFEREKEIQIIALGSCRLRDLLAPEKIYRVILPGLDMCDLPPRVLPEGR